MQLEDAAFYLGLSDRTTTTCTGQGAKSTQHHQGDSHRNFADHDLQLIEAQKSTVKKPATKRMTTRIRWAKDTQKRMAMRS